jgi:hypothetical protein
MACELEQDNYSIRHNEYLAREQELSDLASQHIQAAIDANNKECRRAQLSMDLTQATLDAAQAISYMHDLDTQIGDKAIERDAALAAKLSAQATLDACLQANP